MSLMLISKGDNFMVTDNYKPFHLNTLLRVNLQNVSESWNAILVKFVPFDEYFCKIHSLKVY